MSLPVISTQKAPHKNLCRIVERHSETEFLNSIPEWATLTFHTIKLQIKKIDKPIILDSGCGTGESTINLARLFPDHFIIGVDKSDHRLRRYSNEILPDNLLLVRCELIHFWRLLAIEKLEVACHYLFYPNPWPKPRHLKRRWHAHPLFPLLARLSKRLVMRTNWKVYADEFAVSLSCLLNKPVQVNEFTTCSAITPFERKYLHSGHTLYEVGVNLADGVEGLLPALPPTRRVQHCA